MTVMGEVLMKGLSDRGSTPLRSMREKQDPKGPVFFVWTCGESNGKASEQSEERRLRWSVRAEARPERQR